MRFILQHVSKWDLGNETGMMKKKKIVNTVTCSNIVHRENVFFFRFSSQDKLDFFFFLQFDFFHSRFNSIGE